MIFRIIFLLILTTGINSYVIVKPENGDFKTFPISDIEVTKGTSGGIIPDETSSINCTASDENYGSDCQDGSVAALVKARPAKATENETDSSAAGIVSARSTRSRENETDSSAAGIVKARSTTSSENETDSSAAGIAKARSTRASKNETNDSIAASVKARSATASGNETSDESSVLPDNVTDIIIEEIPVFTFSDETTDSDYYSVRAVREVGQDGAPSNYSYGDSSDSRSNCTDKSEGAQEKLRFGRAIDDVMSGEKTESSSNCSSRSVREAEDGTSESNCTADSTRVTRELMPNQESTTNYSSKVSATNCSSQFDSNCTTDYKRAARGVHLTQGSTNYSPIRPGSNDTASNSSTGSLNSSTGCTLDQTSDNQDIIIATAETAGGLPLQVDPNNSSAPYFKESKYERLAQNKTGNSTATATIASCFIVLIVTSSSIWI